MVFHEGTRPRCLRFMYPCRWLSFSRSARSADALSSVWYEWREIRTSSVNACATAVAARGAADWNAEWHGLDYRTLKEPPTNEELIESWRTTGPSVLWFLRPTFVVMIADPLATEARKSM